MRVLAFPPCDPAYLPEIWQRTDAELQEMWQPIEDTAMEILFALQDDLTDQDCARIEAAKMEFFTQYREI